MNFFLALTLISAILDWYVDHKGWKKIEYLLKPATMLFLFAFFISATGLKGIALWFGAGILLSLAGDIFLMLPKEQFLAGLVAFLLAHLAYIIGFNPTLPPFSAFGLLATLIVGMIALQLYQRIAGGLVQKGQEGLLKPVLAYTSIIAIMLISALLTFSRADWDFNSAATVSIGAALFMLSDAILALNKFVNPIKNGRMMNLSAYHLGQIALIYGIAMHLS